MYPTSSQTVISAGMKFKWLTLDILSTMEDGRLGEVCISYNGVEVSDRVYDKVMEEAINTLAYYEFIAPSNVDYGDT